MKKSNMPHSSVEIIYVTKYFFSNSFGNSEKFSAHVMTVIRFVLIRAMTSFCYYSVINGSDEETN